MIIADVGAAFSTLIVVALLFTDRLEIWHIYLTTVISASFGTFQEPAYRASVTMIVPKKDLVRAGGLQQVGFAVQSILTPVIASVLYVAIGLRGVILIDFATFFFAVGALIFVHIPQPKLVTLIDQGKKPSMWGDATFGWKYVSRRPGLFGLLWYYALVNFFLSLSGVLTVPLVLSFGTPTDMGLVQMARGVAMLIGGVIMSAWGGPKKKLIWGVISTIALSGFGYFIMGLQPLTWLTSVGSFVILFFIPFSSAFSQAVWQIKVPPDIQGRVFAVRAMIASSITPISNLLAGPLADRLFEPAMAPNGILADTFIGDLLGTGSGRGIALVFIVSAFFLWTVSLFAFLNPRIRNLEEEIPDFIPDEIEDHTSDTVPGDMVSIVPEN